MGISGPTIFRRPRERRIIRELKAAHESFATRRNLKVTGLSLSLCLSFFLSLFFPRGATRDFQLPGLRFGKKYS